MDEVRLISMSQFVEEKWASIFNEAGGLDFQLSYYRHSTACHEYAVTLRSRTTLDLFMPAIDGRVIESDDPEFYNRPQQVVFKKNFEYMPLESGYSRLIFEDGKTLMFDPEGFAGDTTLEDLVYGGFVLILHEDLDFSK